MPKTALTEITVIGIDIGKNSFHIVGLDGRGAIVLRQKWSRGQVEARFANMTPCLIGMEACVGAHLRDQASSTSEGDMRSAFFGAYREEQCEHVKLSSPEIDKRLKEGPELVSANFVIPYPPGFPIMVPGQIVTWETINFMRKLDVKEIHGYTASLGLKLLKPSYLAAKTDTTKKPTSRSSAA